MTGGSHTTMTHPGVALPVAGASILGGFVSANEAGLIFGAIGAVASCMIIAQMIWPKLSFPDLWQKFLGAWRADKPYFTIAAATLYGVALYLKIPVPDYVVALGSALGILNVHASLKGKTQT